MPHNLKTLKQKIRTSKMPAAWKAYVEDLIEITLERELRDWLELHQKDYCAYCGQTKLKKIKELLGES
jgi:hypothetical protein